MRIITEFQKFREFYTDYKHRAFVLPVRNEVFNGSNTVLVYMYLLDDSLPADEREICLVRYHPEVPHTATDTSWTDMGPFSFGVKKLTPDKQFALESINSPIVRFAVHQSIDDLQSVEYLQTGKIKRLSQFSTPLINSHHKDAALYLPYYKLIEWAQTVRDYYVPFFNSPLLNSEEFTFLNNVTIPVLSDISMASMRVDGKILHKFYNHIEENRLFVKSKYDPYTTTGRPSCVHGGINFGALNKKDGVRQAFQSRWTSEGGKLVLLDFESYHVRLVADMIGYTLPDTSVHEALGREYFGVNVLTPEQYNESKRLTFLNMYSDIQPKTLFFKMVKNFKMYLWNRISKAGVIRSPISNKPIYLDQIVDSSPSKVFNYLVQLIETERNMRGIYQLKIADQMAMHLQPILYNYDSLLLDVRGDSPHAEQMINEIIAGLEGEEQKYPVRRYDGPNFHELTLVKRKG